MCPGVPTTRISSPSTSTTSPSARPSSPSRCAGSSARTGAPVSSAKRRAPAAWSGWPWVSSTSADPVARGPRGRTHGRRCPSSSGPGSTTTARDAPGSARTQVLVPSSVIGPGSGASTHAPPVPRPAAAPGVTSPITSSAGQLDADAPPRRRAAAAGPGRAALRSRRSTAAMSAQPGQLAQRDHRRRPHVQLAARARRPARRPGASRPPGPSRCRWPRALAGRELGDEEQRVVAARLALGVTHRDHGVQGAGSSRTPVSSSTSRTAVARRSASPGSRAPPGNTVIPAANAIDGTRRCRNTSNPSPSAPAAAASTVRGSRGGDRSGRTSADLDDELDLDRGVQRQHRHADRAAGVRCPRRRTPRRAARSRR